jgi:hypothetical protein
MGLPRILANCPSWLSETIHDHGMLAGLKNAGELVQGEAGKSMAEAFDISVIESCVSPTDRDHAGGRLTGQRVWNECDTYDVFLNAGKPTIQAEYKNIITECPTDLKPGQNVLVYSGKLLDTKTITLSCPGPKA